MSRLLIAGLGNVFKGDDAFGIEVVQRLAQATLPARVEVVDFGIRGIDLTYALMDDYDMAVLVDTFQQGGAPGTVYVVEPEPQTPETADPEDLMLTPHELDPAKVLRMVRAMDGRCRRLVLVGCEPETFGDEMDGKMGLSTPVAAAVEEGVKAVESLIEEMLAETQEALA